MKIAIISYEFINKVIKFVKMFFFKFFEIDLNTIEEPFIFSICGYILIELIYNIFIN